MDSLILLALGSAGLVLVSTTQGKAAVQNLPDDIKRAANTVTQKQPDPPPYAAKPQIITAAPLPSKLPQPKPTTSPSPSKPPASSSKPAASNPKFFLPEQLKPWQKMLEYSATANGVRVSLLCALILERNNAPQSRKLDSDLANQPYIVNTYTKVLPNWARPFFANRYGLTEVLGFHACWLGFRGKPEELLEPKRNIEYAARVLAKFIQKYKTRPEMPEFGKGYFAALVAYMDDDIGANQWLKTKADSRGYQFARRVLQRERGFYV